MVVTSIFILMFDWRLGVIFILGVLCSFLIYGRMQKKGEELTAKQRQVQAASVEAKVKYNKPKELSSVVNKAFAPKKGATPNKTRNG